MSKGICNGFIMLDDNNKVLLVKNAKGNWSFPKGKPEDYDINEYEGARREFFEETGLIGFSYLYLPEPVVEINDKGNPSCNLFIARITDKCDYYGFIKGHIDVDKGDIIEARWFSLHEVMRLTNREFHGTRRLLIELAINIDISRFTEADCFLGKSRHELISKKMSHCCRHGLDTFKSKDSDLSITVYELIEKLKKDFPFRVDFTIIERIVKDCPKKRFEINYEKGRIRAVQGHSGVDVDESKIFTEITEPIRADVMHATDKKALSFIKNTGLNKMARTHIHMCDNLQMIRKGKPIIIKINMESAMAAGIKFYRASNSVILSPGNKEGYIPACHLIFPTIDKSGKQVYVEKKKSFIDLQLEKQRLMTESSKMTKK